MRFLPEAGVVLVHRERAEHVVRALGSVTSVVLLEEVLDPPPPLTAPEPVRRPPPSAADPSRESQPLAAGTRTTRWRDILGWLGIVAGAVVFVAALALRLDDPALVVALMLGMRGGRLILDI